MKYRELTAERGGGNGMNTNNSVSFTIKCYNCTRTTAPILWDGT